MEWLGIARRRLRRARAGNQHWAATPPDCDEQRALLDEVVPAVEFFMQSAEHAGFGNVVVGDGHAEFVGHVGGAAGTTNLSQNRLPRRGQERFAAKTPQKEPVPDGSGIDSKEAGAVSRRCRVATEAAGVARRVGP